MVADRIFKALLAFIIFVQCRAVITWEAIGCDGPAVNGVGVDDIWDNADALSTQALDTIDLVTGSTSIMPKTAVARAADNTKAMFGTNWQWKGGLDSASLATLSDVRNVYRNVQNLLRGNNGYLICTGNPLVYGQIGDFLTGAWYAPIPGTQDAIILRYTAGGGNNANSKPCSDGKTLGQTFNGVYQEPNNGQTYEVKGVLLCTENFNTNYFGVLQKGYTPAGSFPDPDKYRSASGTVLHEMVHVFDTDTYQDQRNPAFGDSNAAYGYSRTAWLAKNDLASAMINPDNYRLFAEMSMSPNTRWGAPTPPGAVPPSSRKRDFLDPPAERRREADRPRSSGMRRVRIKG